MLPISTIVELAPQLCAGILRPSTLLEASLERIQRFESRIHAWVVVDEAGARREARRQDEMLDRGERLGPLFGIPIGIKDLVHVAGFPTRAGSTLTPSHPAERDAPVVAHLRRAGAIILGKTVTTEFACFDPPPTRNPWNLDRTPGGSSSGSAAAVALGMCAAAVGSQTGGSIIRPASYCGVAGLKPTYDRVERAGVVPVSEHLDHVGPIARCVADLAIMLDAMLPDAIAPDAIAPNAIAYATAMREATSGERSFKPPRLGVAAENVSPLRPLWPDADAEMNRCINAAMETLADRGAKIVGTPLPDSFADVLARHWTIMCYEAYCVHRAQFDARPEAFASKVGHVLASGKAIGGMEYESALAHQRRFQTDMRQWFDASGIDALLTPATPTTAPADRATTGSPVLNSPWSYAGLPVVSIPCGLASDAMPVAVQLVGRPNEEAALLSAAAWCESAFGFDSTPTLLSK